MAQPSAYSTLNQSGIDPTIYYAVSASTTPEYPAPPFLIGSMCLGNNGSEFVFVQASTTINLGDFLAITNANQANSLTSTNVISSLGCKIGMAGTVVAGSLTYIPAQAYFWAASRGESMSGNAGTATTAGTPVQLFTSATAGAVTSVTTSSTLAVGLAGIECVSSVTPIFDLTWPRTVAVFSSAGGTLTAVGQA